MLWHNDVTASVNSFDATYLQKSIVHIPVVYLSGLRCAKAFTVLGLV